MFYTENILRNFWIRNGRYKNIYAVGLLLFAILLAGITTFFILFITHIQLTNNVLLLFIASSSLTVASAAIFAALGVAALRSVKIPARIMGKQMSEKIYPVTVYLDMENVPIPINHVQAFTDELRSLIHEKTAYYAYADFTDDRLMEASRELWRNGFRIVHTPHRLSNQSAENFMNVSDLEIGYHALMRAMQRKIKQQKVIIISSDRGFIALAMRLLDLDVQVEIWAPSLAPAYTSLLKVIGAHFRLFAHWRGYSRQFYQPNYPKEIKHQPQKKADKSARDAIHTDNFDHNNQIATYNQLTDNELVKAAAMYPEKAAALVTLIEFTIEYIQSYGNTAPKQVVIDQFGAKRAEKLHEFLHAKHIVRNWFQLLTALDCIRTENDNYTLGSSSAQITSQFICFYVKEIDLTVQTYFKRKSFEKIIPISDLIKHLIVYSSDILKYRIGFLMSAENYQNTLQTLIQIADKMGVITVKTDPAKNSLSIVAPVTITAGVTITAQEEPRHAADLKETE